VVERGWSLLSSYGINLPSAPCLTEEQIEAASRASLEVIRGGPAGQGR
jgi:hypothetical protein